MKLVAALARSLQADMQADQRLYLNGARVAQMSDTLPLDLNSNPLGIGRHVSGIADPFNGHIDEFRIAHVQRSDGWIETTWNNMSDPGAFAVAAAEEQEGGDGEPLPLAGAGVVVCLMGEGERSKRVAVVVVSLCTNTIAATATGSRSIYRRAWQFFTSEALDDAYAPLFGAFGAAWDDAGASIPSGCCGRSWTPRSLVSSGDNAAVRRPVVIIVAG